MRLLSGLFLDIFPRVLLAGASPSEEAKVLYSRCVAELVATLLTLLQLDEELCAFTEQKDALTVEMEPEGENFTLKSSKF